MMPKRPERLRAAAFLIAGSLIGASTARPQAPVVNLEPFGDFSQKVSAYVKIQQDMPRLKPKRQRKQIVDTRLALARNIRETRSTARQGDIFTPQAMQEFRRVILEVLQGSAADVVRKTIAQGEPVTGWPLSINGDYPEYLPSTTLPPTLLLRLPPLPPQLAYRIIGHDFVLQDTEARVIVDFIRAALP